MRCWTHLTIPLAAAAALAACSAPSPVVTSTGSLPTGGSIVVVGPDQTNPTAIDGAIAERLAARGIMPGEPAQYLVQWTYSRRPPGTGLLVPDTTGPPAWHVSPARGRSRSEDRMTLGVTDLADGRQVYSAAATIRTKRSAPDTRPLLVEALLPD